MNTKQITEKLRPILWATSLALLASLQPLDAMQEEGKGIPEVPLKSQKHEGLATKIRAEVDRILENFRRNMQEYYERTRVRKSPVIKIESKVKAIKDPQQQEEEDREAVKEAYEQWDSVIFAANLNSKSGLTKEQQLFIYEDKSTDGAIVPKELEYIDEKNSRMQFVTCLTIGDGDCLFYAAFTEKGESTAKSRRKAAKMREKFLEALKNDETANSLKFFVFEQYIDLLHDNENHPDVPKPIRQESEKLSKLYYKSIEAENLKYDQIMELIKNRISANDIRTYMERLRIVSYKEESYIPLSNHPQVIDPVYLLAQEWRKQIRVFRTSKEDGFLQLIKTVGNKNDPIVNILHSGKHFTRLYAYKREWDECAQIFENYYNYTYS